MPKKRVMDGTLSFHKGLVTVDTDPDAPVDSLTTAINCRYDLAGQVYRRRGMQDIHTSQLAANTIADIASWPAPGGIGDQIVAVCNTDLWHTTDYTNPTTFTQVAATLGSPYSGSHKVFQSGTLGTTALYLADGGPLNRWSGAALAENLAGTPNARRLAVYNQRLFSIAGDDSTLSWSNLNDGDTLGVTASGGGFDIIRTSTIDPIMDIHALKDCLIILHRHSISRFTGWSQDDIQVQTGVAGASSTIGNVYTGTAIAVEDAVYFLGDTSFYRVDSTGIPVDIATQLAKDTVSDFATTVPGLVFHNQLNHEIIWGAGNVWWVYNYRLGAWSKWQLTPPGSAAVPFSATETHRSAINETNPPLIGMNDGFIRYMDVGSKDNVLSDGTGGTEVTMTVTTKKFTFKDSTAEKTMRYVYIRHDDPNTASYTAKVNGVSCVRDSLAANSWRRQHSGERGAELEVTIADNVTSPINPLTGIKLEAFRLGDRY